MIDELKKLIADNVKDLYGQSTEVEITRPEPKFGDYATNVALRLAKTLGQDPRSIASSVADKLQNSSLLSAVSIEGPGFINLTLTAQALVKLAQTEPTQSLKDKVAVVEYSDPNPFKILHAGHLYTSIVGDAMANLLESAGAIVHRVNFGGDIGRHVAITVWAILSDLGGELPEKLDRIETSQRSDWLSNCYVAGTQAYEADDAVKEQVKELNKRLYDISISHDERSALAKIYWTCRQWSYDYFEVFYRRLGIKFEKYYPESEVADLGITIVRSHIPDVYQESEGAVIFDGEKYGLYTNVFINSQGIPTYGAKDVGLIVKKWQDYHYDKSVIITANEIADYMRVVLKSVSLFANEMVEPTVHLTHGLVKLSGGKKMSSRQGNILKATDILDLADSATKAKNLNSDPKITIGAVKYAFTKQSLGGDIIYDPNESVSIEGNSGPYLQYAFARAKSILAKAENSNLALETVNELTDDERVLVNKMGSYAEIVDQAIAELKHYLVANYLYDLAQVFNRFYEHNKVIGDQRQELRLKLVELYAAKLSAGLKLLGIETLDKM